MFSLMKKQLVSTLIFFILMGIIWFGHLPFLKINQIHLTIMVCAGWALKIILFDWIFPSSTDGKQQILQGRFQGAIDFLKKTIITRHGISTDLFSLPWLLMLGPTSSGKTSLLTQANIPFVLSKRFDKSLPATETCDWWATKNAVMIDVPGKWCNKKYSELWQQFLSLVSQKKIRQKLSTIVIALNLPELMNTKDQKENDALFLSVRKQLIELQMLLNTKISFHLIITKCDLLPGFVEFFQENSREERDQAWGITLPALKPDENINTLFTHRFNALIKRINDQLTYRLHHTKNMSTRGCVKDFPLQLEKLKTFTTHVLKYFTAANLQLNGVWLTSATQSTDESSDVYQAQFGSHLIQQTSAIIAATHMPQPKSYFIKQMWLQCFIPSGLHHSTHAPANVSRYRDFTYAVSGGLLVASLIFMGHDFIGGERKILSAHQQLLNYQHIIQATTQDNLQLTQTIALLDSLDIPEANTVSQQLLERLHSFYRNQSNKNITSLYQRTAKTILLPVVNQMLEHFLQANNNDPSLIYQALSARLMLSGVIPFQSAQIAHTLLQLSKQTFSQNQLIHHLDIAYENHWTTNAPDPQLIQNARQQLKQTPTEILARIILENDAFNIVNVTARKFHENDFEKLLKKAIPIAVNTALNGNAVLGKMPLHAERESAELIATNLRSYYLVSHAGNPQSIHENDLSLNNSLNSANFLHQDF
ncbi:MAG: type VI secretion protein IcmF/TssM N-terminal domain-containing protein [Gammaproteobacteria bacterium]|nr:type VI secretion protein IcmF/TssM N-terminal domain-containing protein [Gammaproteobacteria bacterium]